MAEKKTPKRPTSLLVGGFQYAIHWVPSEHSTGRNAGFSKQSKMQILIMEHTGIEDYLRASLFHEIMHAALELIVDCGAEEHERSEEEFVTMTSTLVLSILRQNPDVTAYVLGKQ